MWREERERWPRAGRGREGVKMEKKKKTKRSNGKTKPFPLLLACYCLSSWPRLSTYSSLSIPERWGPKNQQNTNNCWLPCAEHLRESGTALVASSYFILLTALSCGYHHPHVICGRWGSEASSTSHRSRGASVAGAGCTLSVSPQPVLTPTALAAQPARREGPLCLTHPWNPYTLRAESAPKRRESQRIRRKQVLRKGLSCHLLATPPFHSEIRH